jgi:hypothetical protein
MSEERVSTLRVAELVRQSVNWTGNDREQYDLAIDLLDARRENEEWREAAMQTNMVSAMAEENTPATMVAGVAAHLADMRTRAEKAERELAEARATKDMHKARQEQEIARADRAERELALARNALLWYAYACDDQDEPVEVRAAYNAAERARGNKELP